MQEQRTSRRDSGFSDDKPSINTSKQQLSASDTATTVLSDGVHSQSAGLGTGHGTALPPIKQSPPDSANNNNGGMLLTGNSYYLVLTIRQAKLWH